MSRVIERLLDEAWERLAAGDNVGARSRARRAARDSRYRPEALHVLGRIDLDEGNATDALPRLEQSLLTGGEWSDLVYDIGIAHEMLGDQRRMTESFLRVLELDSASDPEVREHLDEETLVAAAEELLRELPEQMLDKLGNVPIMVEERPERYLVEEGFDPRALGVFEGSPWSEQGLTGPALNRIVLYRANIAAATRSRTEALEQVRITLLHETAHFFGMEEDDMGRFGLE